MLDSIDTTVRLITIGASLLLLLLLLAGEMRPGLKVTLVGLLIGAMSYLVNSSDTIRALWPPFGLFDLFSVLVPFWIWLFARKLFEREPNERLMWAIASVMLACWYFGNFHPWSRAVGFYTIHVIGLALVVDLLRIALIGRADDLIEKRRLIRLWLPLLVALQSGGVLLAELILGQAISNDAIQLATAVLIFALTLFSGLALLQADPELLMMPDGTADVPIPTNGMTPSEQVLKEKLDLSVRDGYYRTAGLTIAGLANHLDVPEHRLRALINRRLGHRNFSAFLNQLRVSEAQEILANKAQVDLPILTIAMDLGYNSLPTFNRAFRSETGTTPTDYRRDSMAEQTGQN
jgi:AraC-like DNA-binding protein